MPFDPHILNPYEANELRFTDLIEITEAALTGKLEAVEKLDGQNLTFTVNQLGAVRFIGKGCPKWTVDIGGLSIDETFKHFSKNIELASAFKEGLEAIQEIVDNNKQRFIKACEAGRCYINSELIHPRTTNVINYRAKTICFHSIIASGKTDFLSLCNLLPLVTSTGWKLIANPKARFKGCQDAQKRVDEIEIRVQQVSRMLGCAANESIQNIASALLYNSFRQHAFLDDRQRSQAAKRLLLEEASHLGRKDFRSQEAWNRFKQLDDDRVNVVGLALIPLESISELMGHHALEAHDFPVADGEFETAKEHQEFVRNVRAALKTNSISATPEILERIRVSLRRVNESLFHKNVEGMVFDWKNSTLKLSGAFPGINRVRGYFTYGSNRAQIV